MITRRVMIGTSLLLVAVVGTILFAHHLSVQENTASQQWMEKFGRAGLINASPTQVLAYLRQNHLRLQQSYKPDPDYDVFVVQTEPALLFDTKNGFFRENRSLSLWFCHDNLYAWSVGPSAETTPPAKNIPP